MKALGGFKQNPGCPDFVERALTKDRLQALCLGECYNPSTERYKITRIEVIRIRPQQNPDESVDGLVEDVWKTLSCPADGTGCEAEFTDEDFEAGERDSVYYVRAIQEPTDKVNGALMRCTYDSEGNCIATNHCVESYKTPQDDDCLAPVEERAWSSPIFVDYGAL